MASFDFVECSARAYRYVWDSRVLILSMSLTALAFKTVSVMAVTALGLEANMLRQGLFLLPSHFLEGLVICKIMIMAAGGGGRGAAPEIPSTRMVHAGMIVYVLIKLLLSFVVGMTLAGQAGMPDPRTTPAGPDYASLLLAGGILAGMIWVFRFLWLYVPVALGYGIEEFARRFRGFSSSFYMIGLWILCVTPPGLTLIFLSEGLAQVIPGARGEPPSVIYLQIMAIMSAFADYAISLVSSIGMAYAVRSVFNDENRKTSIF